MIHTHTCEQFLNLHVGLGLDFNQLGKVREQNVFTNGHLIESTPERLCQLEL